MENFSTLNQALLQVNQEIQSLFQSAKSIPGLSDSSFGDWEKACESLRRQLDEEVIRVAVVGPIKSGKSTFLNSILRGDYLKRGAGVVTSIVTRVRAGQALKATLFFKNWDEVNADIQQALALFPAWEERPQESVFDIQQAPLRQKLQDAHWLATDGYYVAGAELAVATPVWLLGKTRYPELAVSLSVAWQSTDVTVALPGSAHAYRPAPD